MLRISAGSGPPDDFNGIWHGGQGTPADISHLAFSLNAGYSFYEAAVGSSDQRNTIWGTVEWDGGLGNDHCTRAAS
jgi:hypothetical protein